MAKDEVLKTSFTGLECEVSGETLEMKVDLQKLQGETSTGKSFIVANTSGWKELRTNDGKYKLNVLIVRVKEQEEG